MLKAQSFTPNQFSKFPEKFYYKFLAFVPTEFLIAGKVHYSFSLTFKVITSLTKNEKI